MKHELAFIIEYEYGIYNQPEEIQDQIALLRKLYSYKLKHGNIISVVLRQVIFKKFSKTMEYVEIFSILIELAFS